MTFFKFLMLLIGRVFVLICFGRSQYKSYDLGTTITELEFEEPLLYPKFGLCAHDKIHFAHVFFKHLSLKKLREISWVNKIKVLS